MDKTLGKGHTQNLKRDRRAEQHYRNTSTQNTATWISKNRRVVKSPQQITFHEWMIQQIASP